MSYCTKKPIKEKQPQYRSGRCTKRSIKVNGKSVVHELETSLRSGSDCEWNFRKKGQGQPGPVKEKTHGKHPNLSH